MPALGWQKLWDNDREGLVWLAIIDDALKVFQQGLNKEAERGGV